MRYVFLFVVTLSISCVSNSSGDIDQGVTYVERKLSFFDPKELKWDEGRNQGYIYDSWIRQPENMRMVFETVKEVGLDKIFQNEERFRTISYYGIEIRKPLNELVDSLILTYNQDTITSEYYRKFWIRRENEGNKTSVYEILTDLHLWLNEDEISTPRKQYVNDTLLNLIQMRHLSDTITIDLARQHFNYLTKIGMHQSAYNLLFESYRYSHLDLNRNELKSKLLLDTSGCCIEPWIIDDTK